MIRRQHFTYQFPIRIVKRHTSVESKVAMYVQNMSTQRSAGPQHDEEQQRATKRERGQTAKSIGRLHCRASRHDDVPIPGQATP